MPEATIADLAARGHRVMNSPKITTPSAAPRCVQLVERVSLRLRMRARPASGGVLNGDPVPIAA